MVMTIKKTTLEVKTCNTCKLIKSHSEFWKQRSNKDGLFGECKACSSKRNILWVEKNRVYTNKKNKASTRKKRLNDPKKALFCGAKYRAKQRGVLFLLNPDDFIIPEICPILGIPIKTKSGTATEMVRHWRDDSPSLDRIDGARGYIKENVVVVSLRANRIKSDATIEELMKIARWYDALGNSGRTNKAANTDTSPEVREQQNDVSSMLSFST